MKKLLSLFILMLLPMLASAQTALDVQNSGCLSETRGEEPQREPTMILTKEGSTLSVQLLNYESNCATQDFNVSSSINGEGGIYGVSVDINPVLPEEAYWCLCPFNISFTIHDMEPNNFYFNCWWYKGQVELTEGEPMVMAQDNNTNGSDYLPFVKAGKKWNVVRSDFDGGYHHEYYKLMNEKVEKAGKTYMKMYRSEDDLDVVYDTGLFREEDRKVYRFDDERQEEHLMFDFSLQAGDTYETYSYNDQKMVSYKVLSVDNYTEGPEVIRYDYDEERDSMVTHHRLLRKWTVRRMDNNLEKTWIEGAGSLEGPLGNLQDVVLPGLTKDYLAYVEYKGKPYLPFSFYDTMNKQIHGCNLPTGAEDYENYDKHHELTYELEGSRLHIYGKVFTQCGPNNYAYFYEKKTDDPLVNKIEFVIQEVEPLADCMALHATNFYVPGFDPNMNYIVVDNQGVEHPVINKTPQMAYRPLVEEGKHWTYDNYMPLRPEKYDHYYYYELKGDTLIAGLHCLKMYSENSYNNNAICYEGALYEVNKKVYCFFPEKNQAELLYDFDCTVGDTIQVREGQLAVKDIRTEDNGGIAIRKYILMPVVAAEDYMGEIFWIEGVGASKDFFGMLPLPGNYNTLNACELNGEKLYQTIESDYTEAGYHKMAIEGKRWNYIHYHLENDGWHEEPYSYVVKGDTIIRRTTYKKLYYQDAKTERFACLLLERGRTVYKNTDFGNNSYDSPVLTTFFEFDREDFGRVFTWKAKNNSGNTNWMVYGVDTVEVNNRQFRRYTCLQKYSEESETLTTIKYDGEGVWHDIWVEGVGSASRGIEDQNPNHEPPVRTTSDYTYFVSCYENGECIFTADDFNVQTYTKPDVNIAYRPFIEEGKVWKVGTGTTIVDNSVQVVDYYYFDGDTIIGGKTCKQMMCQRYVSPNYSNEYWTPRPSLTKVGAWYEEDKKVYSFDERQQTMTLKYDFSLEANDTLHFLNVDDYPPFIIGPKQTGGIEGFKGVYRDIMMCRDEGQNIRNTTWLEGVGGLDAPFRNAYDPRADLAPEFLMSCTVGDEVIYLNDRYEDGATPESMGARKNRFDFTHTIKTKPKARKRSEEEPLLYGEYNDLKLGINLNPLDDAYQVRITDDSGKVVYEKAVNAGSIVGLNIDISAYEKGRYTVTVENSNESFTGEFEAQTTGIEAISYQPSAVRHHIYNLQGQRLSSLQKGLNIVNGQKIYVK